MSDLFDETIIPRDLKNLLRNIRRIAKFGAQAPIPQHLPHILKRSVGQDMLQI